MASPLERSFTPFPQNPYTDPSMIESESDKHFSQSTLQQSAQKRLTSNDHVIAQREREINEIAKGIIELADIFKDLQTMVIDQGTMLDRIDYNVERMATDVKAADKELTVVCSSIPGSLGQNPMTTNGCLRKIGNRLPKENNETLDPLSPDHPRRWNVHPFACKTQTFQLKCYAFTSTSEGYGCPVSENAV